MRWASVEGRRPQVHHDHPLKLEANDRWLVQASGRVVEVLNFQVDETTVDRLVEVALEHRMASVKLRYDLDPALQPILQGSLDRQLSRRHGNRDGFVARHHAPTSCCSAFPRMMMKITPDLRAVSRLSGANVIIAVLIYGRLVGGMLDTWC